MKVIKVLMKYYLLKGIKLENNLYLDIINFYIISGNIQYEFQEVYRFWNVQ